MSDRDHWELRGPIRTLDLHRTWRYWKRAEGEAAACELTENGDHSIVEFREDGSISHRRHTNPDGSKIIETHSFDPAGRLISVQFESSSSPSTYRLYEYDSLARLARVYTRGASGDERTLETYSYDTDGTKTKMHFVDLASQRPNTNHSWAVEGSKAFYSAPNAAKLTTMYNQAGQPRELLFHDSKGALVSRVDFRYDESGHLIEESQTALVSPFPQLEEQLSPDQLAAVRGLLSGPSSRRVHRYDALGRPIETISSMFGSLGSHRETFAYNDYGDPISHNSEDESREYGFDEQGELVDRPGQQTRSEARFLYEYDERGNWLSKVTEVRRDSKSDFSVTSTERRTLTYFHTL